MAKDRQWAIRAVDWDSYDDFRNAVRQAMLDAEAIGQREGGAFVMTPLRVEVEEKFPGVREFETVGWIFAHTYMPAAKQADSEPELYEQVLDENPVDDTEPEDSLGLPVEETAFAEVE